MAARRGRARDGPAGSTGETCCGNVRETASRDADMGNGSDAVHHRNSECPGKLHLALGDRQRGVGGRRREHIPRPHQRSGRDRLRSRCHESSLVLRTHRGCMAALVPRLGGRLRLDAFAFRRQDIHAKSRYPQHALVRRHSAAEGADRSTGAAQGDVRHGSRSEYHHAYAGVGEGHRKARAPGGL